MKSVWLNGAARWPLARQSSGYCLALALAAVTPLMMPDAARADCTPGSPVNNTTITCTGTTTNSNGTNGYGSDNDAGNTYNIVSGATVTGTHIGLDFGGNATINNSGTISGDDFSIGADTGNVVINNSGSITTTSSGGLAYAGNVTNATITNSGTISALGANAIALGSDSMVVVNTGSILAGNIAIFAEKDSQLTNSGTVTGGNGAIQVFQGLTLTNDSGGVISSTSDNSITVSAVTVNLTNAGQILAAGASSTAISVTGDANITNSGSISAGTTPLPPTVRSKSTTCPRAPSRASSRSLPTERQLSSMPAPSWDKKSRLTPPRSTSQIPA